MQPTSLKQRPKCAITVIVFPLDDLDVMTNLDAVCQFCGSPGRMSSFPALPAPRNRKSGMNWAELLNHHAGITSGAVRVGNCGSPGWKPTTNAAFLQQAIGNDGLGLDIMARGVLQTGSGLFAR